MEGHPTSPVANASDAVKKVGQYPKRTAGDNEPILDEKVAFWRVELSVSRMDS